MDATTMTRIQAELSAGGTLTGEALKVLERDVFASQSLGLVWDALSRRRVEAHLETDARHHQPHGVVHGGVWCSVVESMASLGAALQVADEGQYVVGVSNTTDFLRPHRLGRVNGVAEPIHIGRSQQLWQVVLTRAQDDKPVAHGQVRLQNLEVAAPANDSTRKEAR